MFCGTSLFPPRIVFDRNLPRKFLFDFILTEFFHRLHVLAKQHNVNGAGYAKYIRLIGPRASFEHFGARESIGLDDLSEEKKLIGTYPSASPHNQHI